MYLSYFTEEAYDRLLHDIKSNADKYFSEEEWLEDYFAGWDYYGTSKNVQVNNFNPYYEMGEKTDSQKSEEDLTNTRLLYEAFSELTPLQASNKYMWTYLCHAVPEYRKYIQDRWPHSDIETRFFVTGKADSLYNDNALARLWWYGYLTYDAESDNPFALTEILLMNQTICTDVLDTRNRANPSRMKGVLLAIKDFSCELGEFGGITEYFRECKKYLNHYAAVSNFDFLDSEEIHDLAYNYMIKLRDEKEAKKKHR